MSEPPEHAGPLVVTDMNEVRWIWFNRPGKHNAQNTEMLEALAAALEDARTNEGLRALVLAGTGPSFCSGHDLLEAVDNERYVAAIHTADGRHRWESRLFVRPVELLRDLRIPTICRVQGRCLAAGLMFATASDLVIASDDAVFGSPIIPRMAINDAEVPGLAWLLGERLAKNVLWLNQEIGAARALDLGLANEVVPIAQLDARVEEVLATLIAIPADTLALSKDSLRIMSDMNGRDLYFRYHFMSHSFSHQTSSAIAALTDRRRGSRE
jgi:enoyl-CoA hydratase/carnithine racemase